MMEGNKDRHPHWEEKTNHTRLKHLILVYYLELWAEISAKASFANNIKDFYYIDGFAGRGIFINNEQGSPLIALGKLQKVQNLFRENYPKKELQFHIINIEYDAENYEMLERLRVEYRSHVKIENKLGRFLEESKNILVRKHIQQNPCFWFVDPFYGARDFDFNDLLELLFDGNGNPRYRKEALINFMTYSFVRNFRHEHEQQYVLRFLGAASEDEVVQIQRKYPKLEMAIVEYYKAKLREKGLFVLAQRIQCKDPKNENADKIYFHMIHCSHNERALLEMHDIFVKVKDQKMKFEKELNGGQIDFFDQEGAQDIFEFGHQQLINFIKQHFDINVPVNFWDLFVLLLQEIMVNSHDLCDLFQDLKDERVITVNNVDDKKRMKPFKRDKYLEWKEIEIVLVTDKWIQRKNESGEQLSLF